MGANFAALFQHDNLALGVKLLEPDRRRQASRAGPDDDNIVFHGFASHIGHLASFRCGSRPVCTVST